MQSTASGAGGGGAGPSSSLRPGGAGALAERARVAAASATERAACEARYAAACAAAAAAGAPAPFRGPAADSALGECFLDVIALVSASGFALDARPARFLCGLTFRLGARRADGTLDRAGFLGGTADMIDCATRMQAPWLEAARRAPRERVEMREGWGLVKGTTSLMRAAGAGDEVRVRELLAAGALLSCVDSNERWTALHWACAQGSARAVAALLGADASGATVDARDVDRNTPLVLASLHGHEGAVRALLARGARQELRIWDRGTALHQAAYSGHAGVIELLCAAPGVHVNAADDRGKTPLFVASNGGHEGAVRTLLAHGARQELQDSRGRAAMHVAAWKGHAGVVELLCAAPGTAAALALRDATGSTPLTWALYLSHHSRASSTSAGQDACAAVLRAHGAS